MGSASSTQITARKTLLGTKIKDSKLWNVHKKPSAKIFSGNPSKPSSSCKSPRGTNEKQEAAQSEMQQSAMDQKNTHNLQAPADLVNHLLISENHLRNTQDNGKPKPQSSVSIHSKYHVSTQILGRGNYGVVRRCKKRATGELFAVKSIQKAKVRNLHRLKREIEIMSSLKHPNIVTLHEVFEDQKYMHVITPLYTGGDVFQKIMERVKFSEIEAASLISQILDAIAYCHGNGVAHRDLKPENLMFESKNVGAQLKLIDFGLAKLDCSGLEHMKSFVGTTYYLAPEVMKKDFTNKCDIWSIGIILHILLCGYPPFMGENEYQTYQAISKHDVCFTEREWANISTDAKDLVLCLLNKDPNERPSAEVALSHPWFKNVTGERLSDCYSSSNFMQQRFQRHVMRTKLQKLVMNTITHQLTEKDISHLKAFFCEMDKDSNGLLSSEELRTFLGRMGNLTESISSETWKTKLGEKTNSNLTIDLDEFIVATIDSNICRKEKNVLDAFNHFDVNQSGLISPAELKSFFSTTEHAEEAIGTYDLDMNGKLDLAEFIKMMETI